MDPFEEERSEETFIDRNPSDRASEEIFFHSFIPDATLQEHLPGVSHYLVQKYSFDNTFQPFLCRLMLEKHDDTGTSSFKIGLLFTVEERLTLSLQNMCLSWDRVLNLIIL